MPGGRIGGQKRLLRRKSGLETTSATFEKTIVTLPLHNFDVAALSLQDSTLPEPRTREDAWLLLLLTVPSTAAAAHVANRHMVRGQSGFRISCWNDAVEVGSLDICRRGAEEAPPPTGGNDEQARTLKPELVGRSRLSPESASCVWSCGEQHSGK